MNLLETENAPSCKIDTAIDYARKRRRLLHNYEHCYFINIYLDRHDASVRELKRFLKERDCSVDLTQKPSVSIRCGREELDELYHEYLLCTEEPYCVHCKVIWMVACPRLRNECPRLFRSPQELAYDVDPLCEVQLEEFI